MPTYGEERLRGFNLRDGGYYWFINDYIDMAVTGTIFTNGSWALNLGSNYRKRYKFSGNFNFSMSRNHTGDKGTEDFRESKDWALRWTHTQDAKANPYTTFSASVDMSSANDNYYNSGTNINDIANQRKQSSISWSKSGRTNLLILQPVLHTIRTAGILPSPSLSRTLISEYPKFILSAEKKE